MLKKEEGRRLTYFIESVKVLLCGMKGKKKKKERKSKIK